MAKIQFWLREAFYGDIPAVCVRCGQPATVLRDRTIFTGLLGLPFIFLPPYLAITAGRLWLRLPFCERHKNHWRWRRRTAWCLFSLANLLMFAAFLFVIQFPLPHWESRLAGLLCLAGVGSLVLWLILTVTLKLTGICCVSHDKFSVTLAGIFPALAEQLEAKRSEEAAFYEKALQLTWSQLHPEDRPPLSQHGIQYRPRRATDRDDGIQPGS